MYAFVYVSLILNHEYPQECAIFQRKGIRLSGFLTGPSASSGSVTRAESLGFGLYYAIAIIKNLQEQYDKSFRLLASLLLRPYPQPWKDLCDGFQKKLERVGSYNWV